ncbi:YrbL family protein [Paenochrobactrum sp. BZR 588]|uniref:YrbL family protein n=1 Tax=unclassified Paenochrobactrum TaxID=2639760 RepID=UPI003851DFC7
MLLSPISKTSHSTYLLSNVHVSKQPIAAGRSRNVYAIPHEPPLLLKVQKKAPSPRRFFKKWKLMVRMRSYYKQTIPLIREVREYKRVADEGNLTNQHLQNFVSVAQTPQGNGIIVQAVCRENGQLAMTLREIITQGKYDNKCHSALNDFLKWFVRSKIVATDVHLDNIVYDEKSRSMVLIDGIGDKTFVPLRAWFSRLNQLNKKQIASDIYRQVSVHFLEATIKKKALICLLVFAGTAFGIDISDGTLFDG